MRNEFDELAKVMAQSVTRRGALKKFCVGLSGITLAWLGLASQAEGGKPPFQCHCNVSYYGCVPDPNDPNYLSNCYAYCDYACEHINKHSHCC